MASNPASDQQNYMEFYDKRPVACRITRLAGRKTMNNSIYNKAYASDQLKTLQSTKIQFKQHGHFSTVLKERTEKLKSFGIKAVTLSQVVVTPLR